MKVFFNKSAITKIQGAIIAIIIIIALAVGIYYATLPGPTPSESPTPTGTVSPTGTATPTARVVRVGMSWPNKIDPAVGNDECSTTSLCNLYDPLVWPKTVAEGGGVKAHVAESWTVSEDGLVYTFTIRQGIKFHSGRNLTAEDVKFSLDRLLTIGQGFAYLFSPYVNTTEVVDTYTVRINLKQNFGPFLTACMRLYIVDKEEVMSHIDTSVETYGEYGDYATNWLITHDAGSGAYKVVDCATEEWYKYELFTDYWGYVNPLAPTIVIQRWTSTGSPSTEVAMMINKELEITDSWLPEESLALLDSVEGIKRVAWPEMSEYYIYMNTKKPPLDDICVRKAIAYICPYDEMMEQIYSRYTKATSCVPAGSPGYVNCQIYYTNKTLAEYWLSQSKYYPDIINNTDYTIEFHWIQDVPEREMDALLLAEAAASIGLIIQPVKTPWTKVVEEMGSNETCAHMYDILVAAHYPEAGALLETRYHSKSCGTWEQGEWLQNATIDAMIEDALATVDPEERFEKYQEIQRQIMLLCPSLFIYDYQTTVAQQEYIVIPAAENSANATLVMGYERVYRFWQVLEH